MRITSMTNNGSEFVYYHKTMLNIRDVTAITDI